MNDSLSLGEATNVTDPTKAAPKRRKFRVLTPQQAIEEFPQLKEIARTLPGDQTIQIEGLPDNVHIKEGSFHLNESPGVWTITFRKGQLYMTREA